MEKLSLTEFKKALAHAFKAGRISTNTTFEQWFETFMNDNGYKKVKIEKEQTVNQPKKIKVGGIYMVNYIGWKKIKVKSIDGENIIVQEYSGKGEPFVVSKNRIFINFIK